MAQMLTKRNSLHLLFVLLCASPVLGTYLYIQKYSADGCAAADLVETSYAAACFYHSDLASQAGTSCSGTTWSYKSHTSDTCADTGTVLQTGTAGECAADSGLWRIITCDQTPNYIMKKEDFTTTDCSGTASSSQDDEWDTECIDKTNSNSGVAHSHKYVVSGANMTFTKYDSDDCSGDALTGSENTWTYFCDTCSVDGSGSVMVTCPAGWSTTLPANSSVISGAPRVAPVPQLVGAPVLCMALLMKLLV